MDTIAFLGAGSMAAAMVEGMIAKGAYAPGQIACIFSEFWRTTS